MTTVCLASSNLFPLLMYMLLVYFITIIVIASSALHAANSPARPLISTLDWLVSLSTDVLDNLRRDRSKKIELMNKLQAESSGKIALNKSFLITGANSGIGQSLFQLTRRHANQLVLSCRPERVAELRKIVVCKEYCNASRLKEHDDKGSKISILGVDLSRTDSIPEKIALFKSCMGKTFAIDIIFNNAGLMSPNATVANIHAVNCVAPFLLSVSLLPNMMKSRSPSIIYVSSSSHIRGPRYAKGDLKSQLLDNSTGRAVSLKAYARAKYNSLLLSFALKRRLSDTDIIIKNVHPGLVDTPMLRGFLSPPRFLSGILLSPLEAACGVLRGALINCDEDFYSVGCMPAPHRISRYLRNTHDSLEVESELLYKDMLQSLPRSTLIKLYDLLSSFSAKELQERLVPHSDVRSRKPRMGSDDMELSELVRKRAQAIEGFKLDLKDTI